MVGTANANGAAEFGGSRFATKQGRYNERLLQSDNFFMEWDMSMSMSMPSTRPPAPPTKAPSLLPPTKAPSLLLPTKAPSLLPPTKAPSLLPPTKAPSLLPPTKAPSLLPPTTASPSSDALPTLSPPPVSLPSSNPVPTLQPDTEPRLNVTSSPSPLPFGNATATPTALLPPANATATPTALLPPVNATATPTLVPTLVPTLSAQPSLAPSFRPTPTLFQEQILFECTPDGVGIANAPFSAATAVNFQVGYLVESSASNVSDYEQDLEERILESALVGALQCTTGGPLFGNGTDAPLIPMNTTTTTRLCFPEVDFQNDCTVLETTFRLVLATGVDPAVASFLGYVSLQEDMDSTVFLDVLPLLDRIEYTSPLPLLPPSSGAEGGAQDPQLDRSQGTVSATNWTLGAVIAMCVGGVIALWVWTSNRRNRNRRHNLLMEDVSLISA